MREGGEGSGRCKDKGMKKGKEILPVSNMGQVLRSVFSILYFI